MTQSFNTVLKNNLKEIKIHNLIISRRDTVKNKSSIYTLSIVNVEHPRMLTHGHDLRSQRSGLKVKDSDDSGEGGLNSQISQKVKGHKETTSPTSHLTRVTERHKEASNYGGRKDTKNTRI
ncbi:hypothetical protein Tco_0626160 [Tanacetum coccineum]|uniref:Uncharacterized protein n=1 Tax=Tanacetum coccineum TaxID=301880 RepID=A0ABQ4WIS8_9ASTR